VSDERTETEDERNRRNDESISEGDCYLGTLSPDPWDFTLLMPIPVDYFFVAGAQLNSNRPQLGLGPGVGAQVASRQSPILRSVRL
jgi:hypothetical protein